jgi:methyl-accepting chemotaxis protein
MLSRLSIVTRLLLLLAVPLAALLIVSLAGLASISATGITTNDLQLRQIRQAQLEELRDAIRDGLINTPSNVLAGHINTVSGIETISGAEKNATELNKSIMDSSKTSHLPAAQVTQLNESLAAMLPLFVKLKNSLAENNLALLRQLQNDEYTKSVQVALLSITDVLEAERKTSNVLMTQSKDRGESFFILNTTLGVGGFGLALLFGYYISRSITTPIEDITSTVQAVTAGDMKVRAHLTGYDEIAALGNALDRLLDEKVTTLANAERDNVQINDSVIDLLRAVSRLSQRDLTVRVPVTEDVTGPVADAINQLAAETGRVLSEVTRVADQVAVASADVKTKAESVNAAAHSQQSEASDTADKLSHASERLSEISKLADQCNDLAKSAASSTQSAVTTVVDTLRGMTDIREIIQETGKRIKRLGERSQEISGIVDIINKIAERTTVLALNASMQAAAAGDAGRGFGVVADEVQRLAESTRNAAGQIGSLIKGMQVETNDTIGAMENAIGQVVAGSKMAEAAGKQMGDTQGATSALVDSVVRIAASSQEQAQLSITLRDRAQIILSGVRATGVELQEQLQQTVNLTDFSRHLLDSVRVFKLPA